VLADDLPAKGQTKADTVRRWTFRWLDSLKPVEYLLAILLGDGSAAVVDVESVMRFALLKTERDGAPLLSILDGIGEEVSIPPRACVR
jgi:hypothetical protein